MITARRTESVNEGVINAAVNKLLSHASGQSDTFNPSNSKMSAIKILFLLCGVFAII